MFLADGRVRGFVSNGRQNMFVAWQKGEGPRVSMLFDLAVTLGMDPAILPHPVSVP